MAEPSPFKLTRSRVFLLVFFGLALLIALSAIVSSLRTWAENDALPPAPVTADPVN